MADDSFLSKFVGAGSLFEQLFLWSVISQVVITSAGPMLDVYGQKVNARSPGMVLAPPDLADAVIRNYLPHDQAAAEAAKSGMDASRFATLVPLHGDAPGPQQLVSALLRGIIPREGAGPDAASFDQGIREGRLADKWAGMIRELGQAVIPPADAASAVVRHFMTAGDGAAEAAKSGVDAGLFETLTHLAGDAPAPGQLAEALRRGLVARDGTGPASTSFTQGIAEGRLADKWTGVIEGLAKIWPTPADALRATLQGQVSMDEGRALYERLGGDPQFFTVMFDTEGSAPTPLEAADMALRGIIPWDGTGPEATSYEQAFLEGPWRNKWSKAFRDAADEIPTVGQITEYLRYGITDKATSAAELAKRGVTGDHAQWALDYAEAVSTFDFRGLTLSSVMNALTANIINEQEARQTLTDMHVSDKAAGLLISYTKMQRAVSQVTTAVSHIGSLYIARKINPDTARKALAQLNIASDAAAEILATWDLESQVTVATLTPTQIVDAWEYSVLDNDEAMAELENIGYTPYDAWVLLSIKAKAPLEGKPARGQVVTLPGVTPGTT